MVTSPLRAWFAVPALVALLAACAPPSPEAAPPPTITTAPSSEAPVTSASRAASTPAAATAAVPPSAPSSPPVDVRAARERSAAVLRCRQQRCANLGKACFDNCSRHGHSSDPEGHTACNDSCRASYGVEACEDACERSAAPTRP